MRNFVIFIILLILYFLYIVNLYFLISNSLSVYINLIGIPIILGMIGFLTFNGDTWIRTLLPMFIPIIPLNFSGYFIITEGVFLIYIGPIMLFVTIGAGIMLMFNKLYQKFK